MNLDWRFKLLEYILIRGDMECVFYVFFGWFCGISVRFGTFCISNCSSTIESRFEVHINTEKFSIGSVFGTAFC